MTREKLIDELLQRISRRKPRIIVRFIAGSAVTCWRSEHLSPEGRCIRRLRRLCSES